MANTTSSLGATPPPPAPIKSPVKMLSQSPGFHLSTSNAYRVPKGASSGLLDHGRRQGWGAPPTCSRVILVLPEIGPWAPGLIQLHFPYLQNESIISPRCLIPLTLLLCCINLYADYILPIISWLRPNKLEVSQHIPLSKWQKVCNLVFQTDLNHLAVSNS